MSLIMYPRKVEQGGPVKLGLDNLRLIIPLNAV